jgi:hypothetical protein
VPRGLGVGIQNVLLWAIAYQSVDTNVDTKDLSY